MKRRNSAVMVFRIYKHLLALVACCKLPILGVLLLFNNAFPILAQIPANMNVVNLEMVGLKGPVKSIVGKTWCQGPLTVPIVYDSSICTEIYHFTNTGWMSDYAAYDSKGNCIKRSSAEYSSMDLITHYVDVENGDTLRYQASYNLLGFMLGYVWKKNGTITELAEFGQPDQNGKSEVKIYEYGNLRKEGYQIYNDLGFLLKEEVSDLITGEHFTQKWTYSDSLLISQTGGPEDVFNKFDDQNRLIYSKSKSNAGIKENYLTYDLAGNLVEMRYAEEGKLGDYYKFEYNDKNLLVAGKLYIGGSHLYATSATVYDEEGYLIRQTDIDQVGTANEKIIDILYVNDHRGNWLTNTVTVTMMGMSATSVTTRVIEYY